MAARGVGFEGIGFTGLVSFKSALVKGTDEDKLVEISANDTVILCPSESRNFIGIVRVIDAFDKLAGVQIDGFVTMPYDTANAPTVTDGQGLQALQSGATPFNTWVRAVTEAAGIPLRRIVNVDTVNHLVTFQL
jgi:hypothetical protein